MSYSRFEGQFFGYSLCDQIDLIRYFLIFAVFIGCGLAALRRRVAELLTGRPGALTRPTCVGLVDCSVLTVKPDGFVTPVRLDE